MRLLGTADRTAELAPLLERKSWLTGIAALADSVVAYRNPLAEELTAAAARSVVGHWRLDALDVLPPHALRLAAVALLDPDRTAPGATGPAPDLEAELSFVTVTARGRRLRVARLERGGRTAVRLPLIVVRMAPGRPRTSPGLWEPGHGGRTAGGGR